MPVESYAETVLDAGSTPAASTNLTKVKLFTALHEFPIKKANTITLIDGEEGLYRNTIGLAKDWNDLIAIGKFMGQNELARYRGVNRRRVNDVLLLL